MPGRAAGSTAGIANAKRAGRLAYRQEPAKAVDHYVVADVPLEQGRQAARLQYRPKPMPYLSLWLVKV